MDLRAYSHPGSSFSLTTFIMASLTYILVVAANEPKWQRPGETPISGDGRKTAIFTQILVLTSILLPIILAILPNLLSIIAHLLQVPKSTISTASSKFSSFRNQLLTPLPPVNILPRRFTSAIGTPPAKGITLYLVVIGLLTLLLTLLAPESRTPHIHSLADKPSLTYIFQRTGTYAFALFPVVILFSTRNNLLFLLGQKLPTVLNNFFSHSTYLILHRWIGRLVALMAVIHSVLALPLYIDSDEPNIIHFSFWIWGSIAAVALSALVLLGSAYFRRKFYEPFLLGHILLSIIVLVECWYHVQDLRLSGIAPCAGWLLAAVGIWGLDRLVRAVRVVMNGVHKARVTEFGNNGEYVRVDIPLDSNGAAWGRRGLLARPGVHVYAQFSSLDGWKRPWQNHPFSVVPSSLLEGTGGESGSSSLTDERLVSINGPDGDAEKGLEVRVSELKTRTTDTCSGMTLLVKRSKGVTRHFKACGNLLTLLDGPYPNSSTTAVLSCERLLLIGGGIGITAVLPWIAHHSNVKLVWSMKESARCLVEQVEPALEKVAEKDVRIGRRLDLEKLLADEMQLGWSRVGVVVSGPVGLCDDIRVAVASAGRKTQGEAVFELEVDAYSW